MYFTDRGIEELDERRGQDEVTLGWLALRLQSFVDVYPQFGVPVGRLATWLARTDDETDGGRDAAADTSAAEPAAEPGTGADRDNLRM